MAEKLSRPRISALQRRTRKTPKFSLGSASVEYAVITMIVVTVLFIPLPGLEGSLVSTFVTALKQFQSNSTFLMSMP